MTEVREGGKSDCSLSRKPFKRQVKFSVKRKKIKLIKATQVCGAVKLLHFSETFFPIKSVRIFFCQQFWTDVLLYGYLFPSSCQFYIKHKKSKHGFHAKASRQSCFRLSWASWRENWVWFNTANMGEKFHSRRTTYVRVLYSPLQKDPYVKYWRYMAGPLKNEILALLKSLTIATWVKECKRGQWCCGSLLAQERTGEGSCWWGITVEKNRKFPLMAPKFLNPVCDLKWCYQITKLG